MNNSNFVNTLIITVITFILGPILVALATVWIKDYINRPKPDKKPQIDAAYNRLEKLADRLQNLNDELEKENTRLAEENTDLKIDNAEKTERIRQLTDRLNLAS